MSIHTNLEAVAVQKRVEKLRNSKLQLIIKRLELVEIGYVRHTGQSVRPF